MDSSRSLLLRALIVCAVFAAAVYLCRITIPPDETTRAGVRLALPDQVGLWTGEEEPASQAEKTMLPPDTGIARKRYQDPSRESILASIVLAGAEKRSLHRPEYCLPGQGWTIRSSDVVDIPLDGRPALQATRLLLTRPVHLTDGREVSLRACMLYWYVGDAVTTPKHWVRIWLTSWDRVVHHRNHRWAYVYVLAPITEGLMPNGKNGEETLDMLRGFIAGALPTFQDVP